MPGFEVAPIGVVESKARELGLQLTSSEEVRIIAQKLGLDAIVIGAVTDYSPYYPPRMALQVDWIAANACYHPIPVGYGLPWGTPEEEEIPQSLVDATEFELAREQLKTQTPLQPGSPNQYSLLSGQSDIPANAKKTASGKKTAHSQARVTAGSTTATLANTKSTAAFATVAEAPNGVLALVSEHRRRAQLANQAQYLQQLQQRHPSASKQLAVLAMPATGDIALASALTLDKPENHTQHIAAVNQEHLPAPGALAGTDTTVLAPQMPALDPSTLTPPAELVSPLEPAPLAALASAQTTPAFPPDWPDARRISSRAT